MADNTTAKASYYTTGIDNLTRETNQALKLGTSFMYGNDGWEPQRTNNFELLVENLDSITMANGEIFKPANGRERITLSVASFTAPQLEISQITTHYANNSVKWAGKPDFPNSSIVVNDYIGVQIEEILSAWFRAAYDFRSEKIGYATDYKKTAYLVEYSPKGDNPRIWRLEGCWLANFNLGEWSQEGNQQRQINATFVYDRIYPEYTSLSVAESSKPSYTSPVVLNGTSTTPKPENKEGQIL